jgi:hypothetical protein
LSNLSRGLVGAAFGALLFWGVLQSRRATEAERHAAASALRSDSLVAAADTTRLVAVRGLTRIYERRVIQERQRADSIDRLLKRERIARVGMELRVRAVDTIISGYVLVDVADSVRIAVWAQFRDPPYTIAAQATVPRPPALATLRLGIALDSIPLRVRLGCGPAGADGIRPATVATEVPDWAVLKVNTASQSPDLCASPALQPKPKRRWPWLVAGLVVGVIGWEAIR